MFGVWLELVCERCAQTTVGRWTFKGTIPRREMAEEAKNNHWVKTRDGLGWHCPSCARLVGKEEYDETPSSD